MPPRYWKALGKPGDKFEYFVTRRCDFVVSRKRLSTPDIPVAYNWADYSANRDPAMDAVYNLIRKGNQSRKP